jgi:hypothetical protein
VEYREKAPNQGSKEWRKRRLNLLEGRWYSILRIRGADFVKNPNMGAFLLAEPREIKGFPVMFVCIFCPAYL